MGFQREDHVVEADRRTGHPHHAGNREAPHVDVDDADTVSFCGQGGGQVGGDRGLADAALAGGDGDHSGVAGRKERLLFGLAPSELCDQFLPLI